MSYVYFITDGENVKIGKADDVERRLKELQTGNSSKLTILRKIAIPHDKNAKDIETLFHKFFEKENIRNEWFNYDVMKVIGDKNDEDALSMIDTSTNHHFGQKSTFTVSELEETSKILHNGMNIVDEFNRYYIRGALNEKIYIFDKEIKSGDDIDLLNDVIDAYKSYVIYVDNPGITKAQYDYFKKMTDEFRVLADKYNDEAMMLGEKMRIDDELIKSFSLTFNALKNTPFSIRLSAAEIFDYLEIALMKINKTSEDDMLLGNFDKNKKLTIGN